MFVITSTLKLQLPVIPRDPAQHSSLMRSQPQEVWPSALCVMTTSNTFHVRRDRNLPHREFFTVTNRLFMEMSIHVEVNQALELCDRAICQRSHSALQTHTSTVLQQCLTACEKMAEAAWQLLKHIWNHSPCFGLHVSNPMGCLLYKFFEIK